MQDYSSSWCFIFACVQSLVPMLYCVRDSTLLVHAQLWFWFSWLQGWVHVRGRQEHLNEHGLSALSCPDFLEMCWSAFLMLKCRMLVWVWWAGLMWEHRKEPKATGCKTPRVSDLGLVLFKDETVVICLVSRISLWTALFISSYTVLSVFFILLYFIYKNI